MPDPEDEEFLQHVGLAKSLEGERRRCVAYTLEFLTHLLGNTLPPNVRLVDAEWSGKDGTVKFYVEPK